MTATFTEPLLGLSPFIFGKPEYNNQALVDINVKNWVMNIYGACKRVFAIFRTLHILPSAYP